MNWCFLDRNCKSQTMNYERCLERKKERKELWTSNQKDSCTSRDGACSLYLSTDNMSEHKFNTREQSELDWWLSAFNSETQTYKQHYYHMHLQQVCDACNGLVTNSCFRRKNTRDKQTTFRTEVLNKMKFLSLNPWLTMSHKTGKPHNSLSCYPKGIPL